MQNTDAEEYLRKLLQNWVDNILSLERKRDVTPKEQTKLIHFYNSEIDLLKKVIKDFFKFWKEHCYNEHHNLLPFYEEVTKKLDTND